MGAEQISGTGKRAPPNKPAGNKFPLRTPRFWHGMVLSVWLRLLVRNRFAVAPSRWPMALAITFFTSMNSLIAMVQWAVYGRRVARTKIAEPPIFIIGHWRAGTTLLHEMLVSDERFTYPTTYECFAPRQSLLTARFVSRWFNFLLPSLRPMDNMAAGWNHPQEDEFALCNLGVGSPYKTMAFPNRPPQDSEFLDFRGISPRALNRWKAGLVGFLRGITVRDPKPIVLKSPPHTARVQTLLELFPDARFVHIVRDPYVVFPSTVRLWKSLFDLHGMQRPRYDGLDEYVFDNFERMYRAFFDQEHLIPEANLCEVRYEELVRDPVGQMAAVYDQLQLPDFERVRPKLNAYLARVKDYKTNRHELAPETHAQITRRWGKFIARYGYSQEPAGAEAEVTSGK